MHGYCHASVPSVIVVPTAVHIDSDMITDIEVLSQIYVVQVNLIKRSFCTYAAVMVSYCYRVIICVNRCVYVSPANWYVGGGGSKVVDRSYSPSAHSRSANTPAHCSIAKPIHDTP